MALPQASWARRKTWLTANLGKEVPRSQYAAMADSYTIRIFVPDGDPEGVRIVDRMNWTGSALAFPRSKWPEVKQRPEFSKAGVYILSGYDEKTKDERPTVYVGKAARDVRNRIESHAKSKEFWDTGVVFVSTAGGLNSAHVDWLEYALVDRAQKAGRCHLDNDNTPQEAALTEAERADTRGFLKEILQILPLLGIHSFEMPKAVAAHRKAHNGAQGALATPSSSPRTKTASKRCSSDKIVGTRFAYPVGCLRRFVTLLGIKPRPLARSLTMPR